MKNHHITIQGIYKNKSETLDLVVRADTYAEAVSIINSGCVKVPRPNGFKKNGDPKTKLQTLETEGKYKIVDANCMGVKYPELKGWKV